MNQSPPPPVTVAIPAHNAERYLADAIASVQAQTYRGPVTIRVLDDGSTDDTLAVARGLAAEDPRIDVCTQMNQGRAVTRDRLLRRCDDELAAWLDADDLATPVWLEDQIGYLATHRKSVAVSGQGYAMTADARPLASLPRHPTDHESIVARHLNGHANAFYQSCVVMKVAEAIAAGGYREEYFAAEDFDMWLRLAERGQLHNVDRIHLCYRIHDTSANWTISIHQRQQGFELTNAARRRAGLPALQQPPHSSPPQRRDDWNRRVFWINRALREGNAWSALVMAGRAVAKHPASCLLWGFAAAALLDIPFCRGNAVAGLRPGQPVRWKKARSGPAKSGPVYRSAVELKRVRRRLLSCRSSRRGDGAQEPLATRSASTGQSERQAEQAGVPEQRAPEGNR